MSEFIGSRISLVSRSDIRYVGTLHEINSENSTVALENVTSHGTEGRKSNPDEEIAPSDVVYEYIIFRGSDVKDLRIEEAPAAKENKPPQMPTDPAILSSGSRPRPTAQATQQAQLNPTENMRQNQQQQGPIPAGSSSGGGQPGHPPFGGFAPPFYHPQQWGGRGAPPGPDYPGPGMGAYGAPGAPPPGWFPPNNHGFPPGPVPSYGFPPPGAFGQGNGQQQQGKPMPIGQGGKPQLLHAPNGPMGDNKDLKGLAKPAEVAASPVLSAAPTPPVATKPSPAEIETAVQQPVSEFATAQTVAAVVAKAAAGPVAPQGPKVNRVKPVIPLGPISASKNPLSSHTGNSFAQTAAQQGSSSTLRDSTQAATAAVAAAMAKLPAANAQASGNAMDNLTKKVNEMRTSDPHRAQRQQGVGSHAGNVRGRGRGASRGGNPAKIEVPTTDFDFESSNAKFSKPDLVKEAIAGSPQGTTPQAASPTDAELPASAYNKSTSFFDNISSEAKERMENGGTRSGGREWRGEEQKKNVETFGQGSVDNGYRGGYRGRGRGRGGFRGRGGYGGNGGQSRGRGAYRGGRDQVTAQ